MSSNGASVSQRAEELVAAGRAGEAVRLVRQAAADQDAEALFLLAAWTLSGGLVPRDLAEARRLFGEAFAAGHRDAGAVYTAFLANGTGGAADWRGAVALLGVRARTDPAAARQLALIEAMALDPDGAPVVSQSGREISAAPFVMRVERLFTAAECAYLIDVAAPLLEPSLVIDPRSGRRMRDPVRTSDVAAFPLALENPAIHALNRRLAATTGTRMAQGEPLQILRYRPGQEYKAHLDALPHAQNQRFLTALVYLNEAYEGGETRFPAIDLSVRGKRGDALIFRNTLRDGAIDESARHIGMAVRSGTKYIASRWIRAQAIDLARQG